MKLAALQREFCDAIIDGDVKLSPLFSAIAPERLDIYRNAYRSRMIDCLSTIFAKTKLWVGEAAFDAAAQDHIIRHPPSSKSLDDYGAGFDDTLARLFRDDPEVGELAWIEWALHRNFCAADGATLDAAQLNPALANPDAWHGAQIVFVDDFVLGTAQTNIADIWPTIGNGDAPMEVAMLPQPVAIGVWRRDYSPVFRAIERDELSAILAIRNGATFGALCDMRANELGEDTAAMRMGAMLQRWLGDGMIAAIEPG